MFPLLASVVLSHRLGERPFFFCRVTLKIVLVPVVVVVLFIPRPGVRGSLLLWLHVLHMHDILEIERVARFRGSVTLVFRLL